MYDMYPWDTTSPRRTEDTSASAVAPATQAVQFALDRRDNGGDPAPGQSRQ
jgi:hypothetical protein